MLRIIYTILGYLVLPIISLIIWQKEHSLPKRRKCLKERYGFYSSGEIKPQANGIVIHAASVGEVIAATPLIKAILANYPQLSVTVTTVTPTGSDRVKAAFGDSVHHLYLPYDLPDAVKRFLDFVEPKLLIVIETELWPNLIHQTHQRQIPFVIANARLSPRSAKRYGWIKPYLQEMLSEIDFILAQDQVSADRYLGLGFNAEHLVNTGNLKFDLEISPQLREKVAQTAVELHLLDRPIWVAGSTHEGEEKMLLEAHQQLLKQYPDLVLILVPRHPERFDSVENVLKNMGIPYVTRSSFEPLRAETSVLLGNTMGEMMLFYGLAQVAFVGGSLVKHGGHNPLEPIAFELPVISGVHTFNFPEIFAKLREVRGVIEIQSDVTSIVDAVNYFFEKPELEQKISQAGVSVLQENQGALTRHLQLLAPYLEK
ncbi:3-deoxy-D-manno-octulosonic-acid transferase [Glaesserella parasuis ZJ0906]|uniref:3-deoxy-D-manno-octulosonic acid transferase n=1 Tax=Glaesserella parasuis ZJ0906 TaxID=1322346 RepID=A0A806J6R5_GLAPU|nr:3-deoxy-D-manno-octulosonic-acid transferase [Glaesserella parasuis ZJ0906]MDD2164329.1 lipid IV(A) 3-deoxy-D-manno-octulosonic acid transferase [Glaesserella parasuis]MDP0379601.1 lipid IV(A) 3-deoxy-D-manno-octulosonic acid transferase [Glaesserella parasuis]MDP0402155.1 lipid IV(A) 3-deoxy-D-manno-octulosonic acid transferase [Glaesserella parasuis]